MPHKKVVEIQNKLFKLKFADVGCCTTGCNDFAINQDIECAVYPEEIIFGNGYVTADKATALQKVDSGTIESGEL